MKNRFTLLIIILFLLFISAGCQRQKLTPPNFEGVVEVFLRENIKNQNKTDIFLKTADGEERSFLTLPNISRGHYHATEYHNEHIYLIIRQDKSTGDYMDPNRRDELWRYDSTKKGVKLFTTYGLDFRVSNDEQYILIAADSHDPIVILNNDSSVRHSFKLQNIAETENLSGTYAYLDQWNESKKKFEINVKSFPGFDELGIEKEARQWSVEIDPATGELSKIPLQYKSTAYSRPLFTFSYPAVWGEVGVDREESGVEYLTFTRHSLVDITLAEWSDLENLEKYPYHSGDLEKASLLKQIYENEMIPKEWSEEVFTPFIFDTAPSTKYNYQYLASENNSVRGVMFQSIESLDFPSKNIYMRYIGYSKDKEAVISINYLLESEIKKQLWNKYFPNGSEENFTTDAQENFNYDFTKWRTNLDDDLELKDVDEIIKFMVCSIDAQEHTKCSLEGLNIVVATPPIIKELAIEIALDSMGEEKNLYTPGEAYLGDYSKKENTKVWAVFLKSSEETYEIFVDSASGEILEKIKHELPK